MQPKRYFFVTLFTITTILLTREVQSQISVAFGPGATAYSGDVSGPNPNHIRPALNFEVWYQLNPFFYAKAGASIYQLFAEDIYPERNRTFKANNFDTYIGVIFTPSPNKVIMPFITAGIGITSVVPQNKVPTDGNGFTWLNPAAWLPEGAAISSPAMIYPIGAGLKIQLNEKSALVVDGVLRITTTDMLDGVGTSGINVDDINALGRAYFETIRGGSLSEGGVIADGNPNINDMYGILSIKLQYRLDKLPRRSKKIGKIKCPTYK